MVETSSSDFIQLKVDLVLLVCEERTRLEYEGGAALIQSSLRRLPPGRAESRREFAFASTAFLVSRTFRVVNKEESDNNDEFLFFFAVWFRFSIFIILFCARIVSANDAVATSADVRFELDLFLRPFELDE